MKHLKNSKKKHPAAPLGVSIPTAIEDSDAHIPVSVKTVKEAILSFPAGSAGGPDGLKPGHLKNLIGAWEAGKRLLDSLCNLCNFVLRNEIPEDVRPFFFGANLCAFSKKDNGRRSKWSANSVNLPKRPCSIIITDDENKSFRKEIH